jgi:hypothetical protein
MGELRNVYSRLDGKPEGKRLLGRLVVDGNVILKWIIGRQGRRVWTEFIWLRIGTSGGPL